MKKTAIIIVAGMYRSGSTWLFNCVRNTLLEIGVDFAQTGSCDTPGWDHTDKPVLLVKAHEFIPEAAERATIILTSRRNLLDVQASWNLFRPNQLKTLAETTEWIEHLERWRDQPTHRYCMQYDQWESLNQQANVSSIANIVVYYLHIGYRPNFHALWEPEIKRIMARNDETTPPSDNEYDNQTFYFRNHRTQ